MIAAEPTRLTSVGDSSASSPGSTNCSRMKKANASPTSDASPRSRATSPDDDGEGERQDDDRDVPLVVEEVVGGPPSAPASRVSTSVVPLGHPGRDDLRRELDLHEVPGALARRGPPRRRSRRSAARPGSMPQSNGLDRDDPAVGIGGARAAGATAAACCARVGSPLGHSTTSPMTVARPTGTSSSSISHTARRRRPDLRGRRRRVGVGTVAVGVAGGTRSG